MEKPPPFQPSGHVTPPVSPALSAPWHLLQCHATRTARQMALDQALAESVWNGHRPPTLRLYRWRQPGLTVGRHQRLNGNTDGAVRRLTGGRAIHHRNELTFALALPVGHRLIAPTVRATYLTIARPIHDALMALGLDLSAPDRPDRRADRDRFSCFDTPSYGEAMLGPNKLMGLAQWIGPQGLLAQGSLPLAAPGPGKAGLLDLLPDLTWEALAAAIERAVSSRFGIRFTPARLSRSESHRATALARGRYHPEGHPEKG